ncbi:unnamed protein product (mitochondrion) [Plasmodiophora brassicae]|uniref:subtilisin n=1 Tax=Plasmodiophora brassicae TaxID=37360 RepID=A0A3P3Y5M3_PLABS|nr:unnamed protein product [Plasmodiophora brassicae]
MGALPSTDVAVIAVESPDSAVLAIARRSGLFRSVNPQRTFRTLLSTGDSPPAKQSDIPERKPAAGALGDNVRVAVLDSGLNAGGGGLANIVERLDFTSDGNPDDVLGHGTFVASAVAGRHPGCEGQAPNALMHIMRVFTADQTSYTSWFLDAFNYAIWAGIDVLNLSVGGPDHVDTPFIDKILEMCAAGIVVVSAVGNDGPLWGTLLSPADLPCVIGVGGLDAEGRIASFSSRGMTTMDLHEGGYGRVKPDVVTLAQNLRGSGRSGTCQTLSGTSVASPVVAGIVARMLSALAPDSPLRNPGAIKQALVQTAEIVPDATMFEQGAGRLNGDAAVAFLAGGSMVPHVSVLPNRLDLTDCPYFWPFCTQPLFAAAEPVVFNFTVHSSVAVDGYIVAPRFVYTNGSLPVLDLSFVHCDVIWPWTGWFAVLITVVRDVSQRVDVAGTIYFDVDSDHRSCNVEIPFRASVIPRPPRRRRILWDQFHNLQYPRVFAPRDNLQEKSDTLDWHGDHLHTNFRGFYSELRAAGFFVDIAMRDLTCVDTSRYGALVIVDAEEEFFHEEIVRVYDAVVNGGLSLVVIGDWFNHGEMQRARFFDQNTQHWWGPITGGSNIPALNDLLDPFGISFSDDVVEGRFHIGGRPVAYPSGTTVVLVCP